MAWKRIAALCMTIMCGMALSARAEMPIAEDMPIGENMPMAEDELLETIKPQLTPRPTAKMEIADDDPILNTPTAVPAEGDYWMAEADDEPFQSVRIRAVGDLMVHQRQLDVARQTDGSYDFHDMYSYVAASLADADLTIGNLETTIDVGGRAYSGYPTFNSPVSLLDTIRDCGFDFLTLANNHMLDSLYDGMCSTVTQVENYGFLHDGAYRSREEADAPVLTVVNGITIGFISYTEMTNGMEDYCSPDAKQFGVNYLKDADIPGDVKKLRDAGADLVICMPHWGTEYKRRPNATQQAWAQRMIAAGVDVVLGSHPHMVQPVEWVTVETEEGPRTGLVAWSLGNFVSNMSNQFTDTGIILEFTVIRGMDGSISITDIGYVPIYVWRTASRIRALCSGEFLMERPEGMNDASWSRLRTSWSELIALLGTKITVLNV